MDPSDEFDLTAFVGEALPHMVETEAVEGWAGAQPATALLAEDSPLATFLRLPGEPPEGASRAERVEFWEQRQTAELAATEAAREAAADHAGRVRAQQVRAAAETLDRLMAAPSQEDEAEAAEWMLSGRKGQHPLKRERSQQGPQVPIRGPGQLPDYGQW